MVTYDQNSRITAAKALKHPWFENKIVPDMDPELNELALSNLKQFRAELKL